MRITYWGHSGFSVKTKNCLLLFDYQGEGMDKPASSDNVYCFVSHAHRDHFSPLMRIWNKEGVVRLITGYDLHAGGKRMRPGEEMQLEDVHVRAYGSTDVGVSFLVEADGARVFHAGDLNLWHWREESTEEEIREAERAFEKELEPLTDSRPDVAFFPVDPRLGEGCEEGAERFCICAKPRLLIPMHFWDKPEAAIAFANKKGNGVRAMTKPGEFLEWKGEREECLPSITPI